MRYSKYRGPAPVWLLLAMALALVMAMLAPPTTRAQKGVTLEDALAQNLVVAHVAASSAAFGELLLTLTPTGDALVIDIPLGTRFVPDSTVLSEVVSVEAVDVLVQGETSIDPFQVAGLHPDRGLPSPMSTAAYAVNGVVEGAVLELLERSQSLLMANNQAAHLALWSVYQNRPVEEINAELNVQLSPEEVALAAELAAGAPPPIETEEAESTEETEPTPSPDEPPPGRSLPLGLILVGLLALIIGLAVGIAFLAQRQSTSKDEDNWESPQKGGGQDKRPKKGDEPPQSGASGSPNRKSDTTSADVITGSFIGIEGPHNGKRLSIRGNAIITRSPIQVQLLSMAGVSTPHVYLEWGDGGVDVKDLNSQGGTMLNGQPLTGPRKQAARYGDKLTLPGGVTIQINVDGIQTGGNIIRKKSDYLILSGGELEVLPMGHDDGAISDPHCIIRRSGNDYTIRDLNSSNGVILNGEKLGSEETAVPLGATLKIGHSMFSRADS